MSEENQTLSSMAWQRWQAQRRRRLETQLPSHSAASRVSKFEWKREKVSLGSRKLPVWLRYKSGELTIQGIEHREGRSFLQRQPGAPSPSTIQDEIFSSFEARNIAAAAAARRAAAAAQRAAAKETFAKRPAPKEKMTAGLASKVKKERCVPRRIATDSKQTNEWQKQRRTPLRQSLRLATVVPKPFVESSPEESSTSSTETSDSD